MTASAGGRATHIGNWCRSRLAKLKRNEDGTTAVEFGLVAAPFMMLMVGTMSVCLYYFTAFAVEDAVWKASRDMRTGAYQQGTGIYNGLTGDQLKDRFKQKICDAAPSYVDCTHAVRVMVVSNAPTSGFGGATPLNPPECLTTPGGNLIDAPSARNNFNPGTVSAMVLITACVAWKFGGGLSYLTLSNMADGSRLIQASTVLTAEPYAAAP